MIPAPVAALFIGVCILGIILSLSFALDDDFRNAKCNTIFIMFLLGLICDGAAMYVDSKQSIVKKEYSEIQTIYTAGKVFQVAEVNGNLINLSETYHVGLFDIKLSVVEITIWEQQCKHNTCLIAWDTPATFAVIPRPNIKEKEN